MIWDVFLIPVGADVLGGVDPGDVVQISVDAPSGFSAQHHDDVRALAASGQLRAVDAVPVGTLSNELQTLLARARQRRDAAARDEWSRNGADPTIQAIVGSRGL